jgi:hypothetical protein
MQGRVQDLHEDVPVTFATTLASSETNVTISLTTPKKTILNRGIDPPRVAEA